MRTAAREAKAELDGLTEERMQERLDWEKERRTLERSVREAERVAREGTQRMSIQLKSAQDELVRSEGAREELVAACMASDSMMGGSPAYAPLAPPSVTATRKKLERALWSASSTAVSLPGRCSSVMMAEFSSTERPVTSSTTHCGLAAYSALPQLISEEMNWMES